MNIYSIMKKVKSMMNVYENDEEDKQYDENNDAMKMEEDDDV